MLQMWPDFVQEYKFMSIELLSEENTHIEASDPKQSLETLHTSDSPGVFNICNLEAENSDPNSNEGTKSYSHKWLSFSALGSSNSRGFTDCFSEDSQATDRQLFDLDRSESGEVRPTVVNCQFEVIFQPISGSEYQYQHRSVTRTIQSYVVEGPQASLQFEPPLNFSFPFQNPQKFQMSFKISGFVAAKKVIQISDLSVNNDQAKQVCLQIDELSTCQNLTITGCKVNIDFLENTIQRRFKLLSLGDELTEVKTLEELRGLYIELSKSNMGSRTLQKLILSSTEETLEGLLEEIRQHTSSVIVDSYGNYVFQKILQVCSPEQRWRIVCEISPNISEIVKTKTGTFAMQCLLQKISSTQELQKIVEGISTKEVQLSCDQHGTHFIQKLLQLFFVENVYSILLSCLPKLCLDQNGVVVAKKFILVSSQSQWRYYIFSSIVQNFNNLIFHEFGHYIIRQAFETYGEYDCYNLKQLILSDIIAISNDPFSSNVVGKMITQYCQDFTGEILNLFGYDKELLIALLENKSGSFIVHRLLQNSNVHQKSWLDSMILASIKKLKNSCSRVKWGKHYGLNRT